MNDTAARIRARDVSLALLEWTDPPREYRRLELVPAPRVVYRPYDPQGEVEPFDVQADWEENA